MNKTLKKILRRTRKITLWLLKDKSLSANISFLIIAYLLLKFLFFPLMLHLFGLVDFVAVISGSMQHQPGLINNTFTNWLLLHNFNESEFNNWPFQNGLNIGDAVTVVKGNISVGDVIVYHHGRDLIIHRVIYIRNINGTTYYTTKGDANPASLDFELFVPASVVEGKAQLIIPLIGWPRTILYYLIGF